MSTAIAVQLAQIRARSTNSHDLKAQKKAHSQSLLFDSKAAAAQDFDLVYQICQEGFEELCRLDMRFTKFAGDIFSEQSRHEDRTQMTKSQNQQLDVRLEEFCKLVGSRMLLKPAVKAVEWLVRRFRVHEYNTLILVLTFLPYHTTSLFRDLLSILPSTNLPTLKFLHPYIKSLTSPPRHTIIYAASHNRPLLNSFNNHVHKTCLLGYQYPALISFWVSIASEAVAAMLDSSPLAKHELRKQNEEDVASFLLPILNEGLSSEGMPDFRVGCYAILTVLASKTDLDDRFLMTAMEAVTMKWSQSSDTGLICLSILAQSLHHPHLPHRVFQAIVSVSDLIHVLQKLQKQHKMDKLIFGVITGILSNLDKVQASTKIQLLGDLMETLRTDEIYALQATKSILSKISGLKTDIDVDADVRSSLMDLMLHLARSPSIATLVQSALHGFTNHQSLSRLRILLNGNRDAPDEMVEDDSAKTLSLPEPERDFDALTSRIPARTAYEISFLSHSDSYVFDKLADVFFIISAVDGNLEKFSNLPVLRKSLAMSEPLFISFYIRIWCGNGPANSRAAALRTISRYMSEEPLKADVQILFPYVIYALADPSNKVRREATELVAVLSRKYDETMHESETAGLPVLGQGSVYGAGTNTEVSVCLSLEESRRLLANVLVPSSQEYLLDRNHVAQLLSENINSSKHRHGLYAMHKDLKTSLRLSIFSHLCSHVVNMSLYKVKTRLLSTLNQVTKVGNTSRSKLLLPLLSHFSKLSEEGLQQICRTEDLELAEVLDQVIAVVTPGDRDSIDCLATIVESDKASISPSLKSSALVRFKAIWPSMKPDSQKRFADTMLDQALAGSMDNASQNASVETMETLRSLPLSTSVLHSFLANLSSISINFEERPLPSKRRRTTHGRLTGSDLDDKAFSLAINRITLVLELVEDAKAERHPELLKDLFHVLSLLQLSQKPFPDYLMRSVLDSMLAIVQSIVMSAGLPIENTAIRTDVLINCIRNTVSPQVRNGALLLVASLASSIPDLVLHNVMPIFTFSGSKTLSHDDDYSAYVVKQTMDSVIPRLVQSWRTKKQGAFEGIRELLFSFAAAFKHIPAQRRLVLFTSLVDKVGASDYLFALLAILIDKYPDDESVLRFTHNIATSYDWIVRLETLVKFTRMILDSQDSKSSLSASLLTNSTSRKEGTAVANLLQMPLMVLEDEALISKIHRELSEREEEDTGVSDLHSQLLENVFVLAEKSRNNERLYLLNIRLLNASLNSLPFSNLIASLQNLLERTNDSIRQQVLRSFEHRLAENMKDQDSMQMACIAFLPKLRTVIEESPSLSLKLVAVGLVDKIIGKFGKRAVTTIIEYAPMITSDACLLASEFSLRATALLCLATIIEVSGETFIPLIPDTLSKALSNLSLSIQEDVDDADLHNAVYTYMSNLLFDLPWALQGSDLERFLEVSYECANAEMGTECDQRRVETMQLLSEQVEAKELFTALQKTWPKAMAEGPLAVKGFLDILRLKINHGAKATVRKETEVLGGLFTRMFDLRRIQLLPPTEDSYTIGEVEEAEDDIIGSAMIMFGKLNDTTLRPFFLRMLAWSAGSELTDIKTGIHRQITWYRFLLSFFATLKSHVTNYAQLILDNSVDILTRRQLENEESISLWRQAVLTLRETFEHDQEDFFQSPNHFNPISAALLSQLPSAGQISLLPELIPAITELAVATDSTAHHKEINTAILQNLRSESAAVRLAAIQCQRALTERLGEEWLAQLPEMLPFISEALEDDDETVEREVQRWVVNIEGILGESLNPMLQ